MAVIGAGRAGSIHARNIATRIPGAELVAVCDPDVEAVERVLAEPGCPVGAGDYREVCGRNDVWAVVIAAPTGLHREIACEAARHGKHIFLEKPMATCLEECGAILSAVEKAGVMLQMGFRRRFDPAFRRAREMLDSGELGRPMVITSTGRGPSRPAEWMYDVSKSHGVLAEVNSHDWDSLRWLAGSDTRRVYAEAGNFKCRDVAERWPDYYDTVAVTIRFRNGAIGMLDGAMRCEYGYDARMEVLCEKGVLHIGSILEPGLTVVTIGNGARTDTVRSWRQLFREAYVAEMEYFVECIRSGTAPRVTGIDGMKSLEAAMAANRSIRTGRAVEIGGDA